MIKKNLWIPDTHTGVKIEYEWDDALPLEERVHNFVRFQGQPQGARFEELSDPEKFDKIIQENQTKNIALSELLKLYPEELKETDSKGNEAFKEIPKWEIKEDGNIEIELPELQDKNSIKTELEKIDGVIVK